MCFSWKTRHCFLDFDLCCPFFKKILRYLKFYLWRCSFCRVLNSCDQSSQLICRANQLAGFYMMATLAFNQLIIHLDFWLTNKLFWNQLSYQVTAWNLRIQSEYRKIRTRKKLRIWTLFTQWVTDKMSQLPKSFLSPQKFLVVRGVFRTLSNICDGAFSEKS